jgi:hypothetical protein
MSFHVPNECRIKDGLMGSDNSYGNNGAFQFSYKSYDFHAVASDGMGWEHVSVTIKANHTPSWEQMCFVKSLFWDDEDTVIQFHPKKSDYVNNHNYCLHLWRSTETEVKTPPTIMVGIK